VNLYVYSDIQDPKDYAMDNATDIYAKYFFYAFVVQLAAASILIKDGCSAFLSKKKSMILVVIVGIFQMANIFIFAVKSGQLFV